MWGKDIVRYENGEEHFLRNCYLAPFTRAVCRESPGSDLARIRLKIYQRLCAPGHSGARRSLGNHCLRMIVGMAKYPPLALHAKRVLILPVLSMGPDFSRGQDFGNQASRNTHDSVARPRLVEVIVK